MKHTHIFSLVFVLGTLVILGAGCSLLQQTPAEDMNGVSGHVDTSEIPTTGSDMPYLVLTSSTEPFGLLISKDSVDVVDATNTTTVLFADVLSHMRQTQKIPPSFDVTNAGDQTVQYASIISVFDNKTKVLLQGDPGADGFGVLRPVWVFDSKTNTMSFLDNINATGPMVYIHETTISPDGTKMALVLDSGTSVCDTVRVFDFSLDTIKNIKVALGGHAGASLCMFGAGTIYRTGIVEWVSDSQIKYSVFGYIDPAEQLKIGLAAPLLEQRVFQLQ